MWNVETEIMVLGKNLRVRKKAEPLSVVLESKTLEEALLFQYTSILSLREFRWPKSELDDSSS